MSLFFNKAETLRNDLLNSYFVMDDESSTTPTTHLGESKVELFRSYYHYTICGHQSFGMIAETAIYRC